MRACQSAFNGSSDCVRVNGGISELFQVYLGVCLCSVMSTCLFNILLTGYHVR